MASFWGSGIGLFESGLCSQPEPEARCTQITKSAYEHVSDDARILAFKTTATIIAASAASRTSHGPYAQHAAMAQAAGTSSDPGHQLQGEPHLLRMGSTACD